MPPLQLLLSMSLPNKILWFCVLIAGLVVIPGCGQRRPPLPPVERVQQRTEFLSGAQQGNEVILSWPAPQRNAPDSSVQSIRRIDVYRLAEKPGTPLGLTEVEFAARATLVGSVTFEQIQTAGDTLTYRDKLELAGQGEYEGGRRAFDVSFFFEFSDVNDVDVEIVAPQPLAGQ